MTRYEFDWDPAKAAANIAKHGVAFNLAMTDAAISRRNRAMKDEYDFSKAERGKFFRRDVQMIPPVHLDPEVLSYLAARAEARGTSLSTLVNELLKKDIELIEAA